jgi:hypothetical protein
MGRGKNSYTTLAATKNGTSYVRKRHRNKSKEKLTLKDLRTMLVKTMKKVTKKGEH